MLDFNLFKANDRYWRKSDTRCRDSEQWIDRLEIHFLELNKMKEVKEESPLMFWIEFSQEVYERAKSTPKAREILKIREKLNKEPSECYLHRC